MAVIVDHGLSNLGSIVNMLRKLGHDAVVSRDPHTVAAAERLILPGVGSFDAGMRALRATGLVDVLRERVLLHKVPLLGICLGMQLLAHSSEEGVEPGLGWMEARVLRLPAAPPPLRVPNMGWGHLHSRQPHALLNGLPEDSRFYFAHSYHLAASAPQDVVATARHGREFHAVVAHGNIAGVQFHPEKSHHFGLALLGNFLAWNPP
jgi:glutamine amidotransferase